MKEFKICSLCLGETDCIDIFSMENNIDEDIFVITGIQIKQDGEYPTGACTACLDSLKQCMEFRKQVQESFGSITAGSSYAMPVEQPKKVPMKSSPPIVLGKNLYKCHKCLKGFTTKRDVTFHLTKGTCQFRCPECSLIFGKKAFFDYHMKSEHQEPVETVETVVTIDDKEETTVVEKTAEPPAPQIEMIKVEMMDFTEKEPEEYKCVECNLIFATETSLTAHKIRKHNQKIEMFPCQLCTPVISFISQKALAAHTDLLHPEPLKAVWEMIEQPEESELMEIYKSF